jgi:3-deoxy-manno-octulosonate cytidylyltransferase (CMP-KDO synthetase)
MKIIAIIPARMAATRFPGKPMAMINGIPMIGHCYLRSKMCEFMDEVYVATCDQEIYDYIISIGGKVIMTNDLHERATERVAEAVLNIEAKLGGPTYDIIVMVQGDEPLVHPDMLKDAAQPLLDGTQMVSNLMSELSTSEEICDSNVVKVVFSNKNLALYMSRESIPSNQKYNYSFKTYRQLGLIAFTRKALFEFVNLKPTPLEIIESVDMNRFLENNISIYMQETKYPSDAVDILADLNRVNTKMEKDELFQKYKLK